MAADSALALESSLGMETSTVPFPVFGTDSANGKGESDLLAFLRRDSGGGEGDEQDELRERVGFWGKVKAEVVSRNSVEDGRDLSDEGSPEESVSSFLRGT